MASLAQMIEPMTQIKFDRIVAATDFSNASRQAFAHAVGIAKRYRSELLMVHALPREARDHISMDPLPKDLDRKRAEVEREVHQLENDVHLADIKHRAIVERGPVWDVIFDVLQREQVDLLVMGTHGRGALKKLALGSVAEEVVRQAACPVLTVGPKAMPPAADKSEFRNILFATDFGPAAEAALPYALFLAESCGAKLVLLHMVPPLTVFDVGPSPVGPGTYASEDFAEWQRRMREEGLQKLRALIPPGVQLSSSPEYVVETNFLPDGILEVAACYECDLIVMGANRTRSPRVASHIPWALTHDVLCEARCPVLTVRDRNH